MHANRAQLAAGGSPTICAFKDVTLEANGVKWQLPQAGLRNENSVRRGLAGGRRRTAHGFVQRRNFQTIKINGERTNENQTHHLAGIVLDDARLGANPGGYITAGTNDLVLNNWWGANTNFAAALAVSPTNEDRQRAVRP